MANFTAADIKALREQTAAGMMDVKKALEEADGDMAKAAEILRIKGLKGVTKREGRSTSNGLVAAKAEAASAPSSRSTARPTSSPRASASSPWPTRSSPRPSPPVRPPTPTRCSPAPARRPHRPGAARRGQRGHRREDRGPPRGPVEAASTSRPTCTSTNKDLPPQIGVLVATERRRRVRGARRRDAHRGLLADRADPRGRRRPTSSRTSGASPRPPPARRASPRPPCPRSSRAGSTASSRRTSCSSRPSPRTRRSRSPRCSRRPAPRPPPSPASASATDDPLFVCRAPARVRGIRA
jgi:elongation factor Ts